MLRRAALGALVAMILVGGAAAASAKGNGGGGGSKGDPSIALNQTDAHLGETITFTTVFPSSTKNPRIQVECYQNGVLVYGEAGSYDHAFLLGGGASIWLTNGGPAYCDADLFDLIWNGNNPQQVVMLSSMGFDAAG